MACSQEVVQAASQSAMKPFNLLFKQEAQFGEVGELLANTFRWKHPLNFLLKQGTEILILLCFKVGRRDSLHVLSERQILLIENI